MKKYVILILVVFCCGCDGIRLSPGQAQKENAWLHNRTTQLAAEMAEKENASDELQSLTNLGQEQSRAFVSYFGLPNEYPKADTVYQVLSSKNIALAETANTEALQRPDQWQAADGILEAGIAIAGIAGGAWGLKISSFLKEARAKSQALKEVV